MTPRLKSLCHYSIFVFRFSFLLLLFLQATTLAQQPPFSVVEATIGEMQTAMRSGRITSRAIVQQYLDRITKYEPRLNAVMTLNPRALDEADAPDRERAQGKVRGPLHGIPIALKDNIHTTAMPTTGGALVFKGFVPPYEATITANLREAGAVVIAKTNMTELANWIATGMPGNYNAIAGYGFNPYDPRADPRETRATLRRLRVAPSAVDWRRQARIERRWLELGRGHCREFLGGECGHGDVGFDPYSR